MKTCITICFIIFSAFMLNSCQQEALEFSCDPVLNEIIVNHKAEYAQYSVQELTVSDIIVQRAIFRSYTPTKKREIWLEKINFLLENEGYTPMEFIHVQKLKDQLSENYFEQDSVKAGAGKRAQFFSDWRSYAKERLGWSEKYIVFVIYRLYTMPEQFEAELSAVKAIQNQAVAASEGTCSCSSQDDYCGGARNCFAGYCSQASGCGTFWQSNCDGTCN